MGGDKVDVRVARPNTIPREFAYVFTWRAHIGNTATSTGSGEEEARAEENRLSLTKKICAAPVGTET
jgi:hypothetical protein